MTMRCVECAADKSNCDKCKRNPKYNDLKDYFMAYIPTCPRGYKDCVGDPTYIKFYHPVWYRKMYGDKTPEEVSKETCVIQVQKDPDEKYFCYDDEDK